MECHVSECAAEAYSVVALKRHGQPLPQEGLLPLIPGDGLRPPANLIYEVCTGSVVIIIQKLNGRHARNVHLFKQKYL